MTPTATIAVLALALLVGISLGLLGGGGSILAVPILTAVGGVEPRAAIASSLLIVGTTSALGLLQHARAGRVRWRVGVVFGAAGVVGGLLGRTLPPGVLMVLLAGTMIAAAVAMLRRRPRHDRAEPARPRIALVLVLGTVVGSLAGLVGAGGAASSSSPR
ncbi:sulfite exporter TauE/SafE family protein [Microbacterium profundi]|uniref:sulfite exporter TauE/SafE family protein n=1 Tax=Microbacterium profundi TaxID=450380 RepID=UPI0023E8F58F|nr:sulfite exporter TauE/SafE family protein [Microbacterium profundi]